MPSSREERGDVERGSATDWVSRGIHINTQNSASGVFKTYQDVPRRDLRSCPHS